MSELTCIASTAPAEPTKLGTVGKLLPGMEMRIEADGELLVRGPLVMKGYRGEPAKTAEAISADGWLSTGDIVTADADGYLTVIDRKKELIINASGKNMSPAAIETAVKTSSSLIGEVVAIGDGRKFNTALITLSADARSERHAHWDLRPRPRYSPRTLGSSTSLQLLSPRETRVCRGPSRSSGFTYSPRSGSQAATS